MAKKTTPRGPATVNNKSTSPYKTAMGAQQWVRGKTAAEREATLRRHLDAAMLYTDNDPEYYALRAARHAESARRSAQDSPTNNRLHNVLNKLEAENAARSKIASAKKRK
jgi:nicotinamide mononucleotide adenylyltransferase